jgi:hypothetical protein
MSVRVVKEGKLPEEQVYTGTCRRCGCEVETLSSNLVPTLYGFCCTCPTKGCGFLIACASPSNRQRYVDTDKVKYTERTEQ